MSDSAKIIGMGWVFASSMGWPGHIKRFTPGPLPELSGKSVLGSPYKPFGRMDKFSKIGFAAIAFAMTHAGIPPLDASQKKENRLKQQIALIASSETGCLETDFLYQATLSRAQKSLPSPALFAYTLPSCFLGEAAIYYGLTGEAYMMEEQNITGLTALSTAMDCLGTGNYKAVICGICNSNLKDTPDSRPLPGALFLILESCDMPANPKQESHRIITRNTQDRYGFSIKNKPLTDLTDIEPQAWGKQYNIYPEE